MAEYLVAVSCHPIVKRRHLHPQDRAEAPIGKYETEVDADNADDATELGLDWFHQHYGIKVLDDFDIEATAEPIPEGDAA